MNGKISNYIFSIVTQNEDGDVLTNFVKTVSLSSRL
jgi:hypothetical protein